jgi:hypothetical protein
MKTSQELETELVALGSSAAAVAKALKAMGIKGRRSTSCGCPLANYLSKITGQKMSIGLYDGNYAMYSGSHNDFHLPQACTTFIKAFDSGRFNYLLEK